MSSRIFALWALLALGLCERALSADGPPKGIGVLGDSYSDEYRFYPPHCSRARNWVEFLAESRGLNFGSLSEGGRSEPRNQGFAYNWARSAATTTDMITSGQHTGLARQVSSGEVDVVVVFIGGNDFINAGHASNPDLALKAALPIARANLRLAVETILKSDRDVRMILITVPDIRHLPEFRDLTGSSAWKGERADAFSAALRSYNDEIQSLARRESRVAIVDLDRFDRVSHLIAPQRLIVGDLTIDRLQPEDDPRHFFVADRRHMGTIPQGMMAKLIVDKLNLRWKAGIAPIREEEVVSFASKVFDRTRVVDAVAESSTSAAVEGGGR